MRRPQLWVRLIPPSAMGRSLRLAVLVAAAVALACDASGSSSSSSLNGGGERFAPLALPVADFSALRSDGALVAKLQRFGTIALRGLPGYAELRARYLAAAAACALRAGARARGGVLHRVMDDGTERFTMLSLSGREDPLPPQGCLEFHAVRTEFSALVELGVGAFSEAVDLQLAGDGSNRPAVQRLGAVVGEGQHMDHFHAYVPRNVSAFAGSRPSFNAEQQSWALDMHSDLGIFIAMAPPAFYEIVQSGDQEVLRSIDNPDANSGLVIRTPTGDIVRPDQHPEDLVIMVGDGLSAWTDLPVKIPAVVHGMVMPATCHSLPLVRAWFGKMILPAPHFPLQDRNETFGTFTSNLNGYFADMDSYAERSLDEKSGFSSVACPSMPSWTSQATVSRRLDATTCSYRICEPVLNPDYHESCQFWCNLHQVRTNNAINCAKHCRCSENLLEENVFMCWSGCFEYIENCPPENQICVNEGNITDFAKVECRDKPFTEEEREQMANMSESYDAPAKTVNSSSDSSDASDVDDGVSDTSSGDASAFESSAGSDSTSNSGSSSEGAGHVHDMASMSGM